MNHITRILIVEDQGGPLRVIESAVREVGPQYLPDVSYDVSRCYSDARRMVQNRYDFVLLDHRMPFDNMGDLEDTDFDRFCRSLENIGYSLIEEIKRIDPKTVVIGTSSLSESELHGQTQPDYTMNKMWGEAEKYLTMIFEAERNKKK